MEHLDFTYAPSGERHEESEPLPDQDRYSCPDRNTEVVEDFAEQADIDVEDQSPSVNGDDDDDERGAHPPQPPENLCARPPGDPPWFQKRWNGHWVMPNVFLRGPLFAGVRATHKTLNNTSMATQGDFTIVATGKQPTQSDLDVWAAVVNLENGNRVDVSCHTLLRHLDRHDGSSDRAWLISALQRLHKCHVVITFKDDRRRGYTGLLIKELQLRAPASRKSTPGALNQKRTNNQIEAFIDPAVAHLFEAGWTQLPTSWRRQMRKKPLANWLTAYYLTHREPWRIKVDTLRRFSGSPGRSSTFKKQLDEALAFVKAAGYFPVAMIVGDLVDVVRGPYASETHPNAVDPLQPTGALPSAPIPKAPTVIAGRKVAVFVTSRLRRFIKIVGKYLRWSNPNSMR